MINQIIGLILILFGSVFLFLGSLGLLRMPDIFNRLQAGTKATTLGIFFSILGAGIYFPDILLKSILIILFIFITNPVSSSTLARSAYRNKIKKYEKTIDEVGEL